MYMQLSGEGMHGGGGGEGTGCFLRNESYRGYKAGFYVEATVDEDLNQWMGAFLHKARELKHNLVAIFCSVLQLLLISFSLLYQQ